MTRRCKRFAGSARRPVDGGYLKSSIFTYEIITGHVVRRRHDAREIGHRVFLYRHVRGVRFIDIAHARSA